MTLSHTLQSSPVHRIKIKINGLYLSSVFISNLNLISLTLSLRHRPNSQLSSLKRFHLLPISLPLSISDKYSNQKPEISSPNPLVSHKPDLSLTL